MQNKLGRNDALIMSEQLVEVPRTGTEGLPLSQTPKNVNVLLHFTYFKIVFVTYNSVNQDVHKARIVLINFEIRTLRCTH